MRSITLSVACCSIVGWAIDNPLPLFLFPQWEPETLQNALASYSSEDRVLRQELTDYLIGHEIPKDQVDTIAAATHLLTADGDSTSIWRYIADRLASMLPLDDPVLENVDSIAQHNSDTTLFEEQLLGNSSSLGGIRGLIRVLLQLKIAARESALESLNGSGVTPSQEILDAIWNDPYKVLRNTPFRYPKSGFNVADVYCKAYGIDQCKQALKYGLGRNVTVPSLGSSGSTNVGAVAGSTSAPTDSTSTAATDTTTATSTTYSSTAYSTSSDGMNGQWMHFDSSDWLSQFNNTGTPNTTQSGGYHVHNYYIPTHHHAQMMPTQQTASNYPVQAAGSYGGSVAPIMPVGGVLHPIVLAPPTVDNSHSHHGQNKMGFLGAMENVKKHLLGLDHHHHHSHHHSDAAPLTYIYPMPVMVGQQPTSAPVSYSTEGPSLDARDNRPLWKRLMKSDSPIYDGIVRRGNRFAVMTDAVAELPVIGPAAVFMNEAANMGRDAMLQVIEVANNFEEGYEGYEGYD